MLLTCSIAYPSCLDIVFPQRSIGWIAQISKLCSVTVSFSPGGGKNKGFLLHVTRKERDVNKSAFIIKIAASCIDLLILSSLNGALVELLRFPSLVPFFSFSTPAGSPSACNIGKHERNAMGLAMHSWSWPLFSVVKKIKKILAESHLIYFNHPNMCSSSSKIICK